MPDRFRHEIAYFMALPDGASVPQLPSGEYWVRLADSRQWLEDGVFTLVSPLDSASRTEIELSEEQEAWLEWMVAGALEHIRLESAG
ncbi:MAG: hypothetical protein KF708_09220 [Pirellulales bacterium]|nr:hypothetical protein [Pirellulales bacterium]